MTSFCLRKYEYLYFSLAIKYGEDGSELISRKKKIKLKVLDLNDSSIYYS